MWAEDPMVIMYPVNLPDFEGFIGLCKRMSLFIGKSGVVGIRLATYSQIIHRKKKFSVLYLQVFYEFGILSRKIIKTNL